MKKNKLIQVLMDYQTHRGDYLVSMKLSRVHKKYNQVFQKEFMVVNQYSKYLNQSQPKD
jgi:NADH:ubiquinone oxidoreductase subunit E